MKKKLAVLFGLLFLHAGCALIVSRVASPSFQKELDQQLREGTHFVLGEQVPVMEPLKNRLLKAAQQAGVSRAELQVELFRRVEGAYAKLRSDPDDPIVVYASHAFSGLTEVGDAKAVDQLTVLALNPVRRLFPRSKHCYLRCRPGTARSAADSGASAHCEKRGYVSNLSGIGEKSR